MRYLKSEVEMGFSESFALVTVCIITKMFYGYLPTAVSKYGPAAWYVSLISALAWFLVFRFALRRGGIFSDNRRNLFGRATGFAVFVYFLLYTAANLHEIIRIIKIYNFPTTPSFVFAAGFVIAAVVINYNGLFSVGKLSGFYIKLILAAFVLIFILGLGQYDFVRLAPFGGYGIKSIAKGGATQLTLFSELFLLLILSARAGGKSNAKKAGGYAAAVSALIVALSFVCYICVYDYTVASGKSSGLIEVVKNAYYGHLLQRMESLFFLIMVVSSAISVCVWFFATVHVFSGVFKIRDKKELLLPIAIIVLCLSLSELNNLFNIVCRFGGLFLLGIAIVTGFIRRKS